MKITYPIDPNSLCRSGFSVGNGSQSVVCRTCGKTTYSVIPLRKFDLDAMRDQAAREAEAGR